MTYDAVLVARRGLGVEEMRLIDPVFKAAVRWATFIDKAYEPVPDLIAAANAEYPDPKPNPASEGARRNEFMAKRRAAREELARIRKMLMLDEAPDG